MSIRSRLLLLVLAVWFPAVAAFGLLAAWAHSHDEAAARASLRQIAESLSIAVERELDMKAVMAATLATSDALRRSDFSSFQSQARIALENDPGASVFALGAASRSLDLIAAHPQMQLRLPELAGLPQAPGPQAVLVPAGPDRREPVVAVFTAMAPGGGQRVNVGVALPPSSLQSVLERISLPDGAIAKVLDQRQRVIARSHDAPRWVGKTVTDELLVKARAGSAAFFSTLTLDGVRSLTYVTAPNRYGWSAAVATSEAALDTATATLTAHVVAAAAALLLVGLLLAYLWARRISAPMATLLDAAAQVERHEIPPPLRTGLPEADAVGAALHRAAQAVRQSANVLEARVAEAVRQTETAQASLFESRKREAIGRLTGGIAHDFNNLLQTIGMGLQVLDRTVGDGPHRRSLDAAFRACGKAADLIRQMQTFGRAQAPKPQPVPFDSFMLKALELTTRAVGPKVSLQAKVAPGVPAAYADPTQLELALLNLVFNARDAMPQGGDIQISVSDAPLSEARAAGASADGPFVCLEVSDTGTGMDAQTLARATEPFFTTKPVGSGSGLGLAQVVSFARQSGGGIRLRSTPGQGTRVRVFLPCADANVIAKAEAIPAAAVRRALSILMVEDDLLVSTVVVSALQSAGHKITLHRTADEALRVLQAGGQFDVLFTDMVMPGAIDGYDLAQWCREHRPDIGIVLATGYSAKASKTAGPLLRKPYRIEELLEALETAARTRPQIAATT